MPKTADDECCDKMPREPTHEKRNRMVFRFVVLQTRMHSPLFGLRTCAVLPEASSRSLYMSANNKGSGETAFTLMYKKSHNSKT